MKRKPEQPKTIELTHSEALSLFNDLDNSSLKSTDKKILRSAVNFHLYLEEQLKKPGLRLKDIRALFGIKFDAPNSNDSSEDSDASDDQSNKDNKNSEDVGSDEESDPDPEPANEPKTKSAGKTGGRIGAKDYTGLNEKYYGTPYPVGSSCPLCEQGKLYAYDDKVIIRLTGATANGNKITMERCRCNLCQEIFSVDYSAYGNSKYDTAFKTQLVMNKYWNGLPFKRMESCYEMNGCPVPDATQWQLVQSVAKVVEPVYQAVLVEASNCDVIGVDDTRANILSRTQALKNERQDRTGTFTSGFVCTNIKEAIKIALYFNGEQHAGENFADLLEERTLDQEDLVVMSDGLDTILPKALTAELCNCMSHGVRKFKELLSSFSVECRYILKELKKIYVLDSKTKKMDGEARLAYHQAHSKPILDKLHKWMKRQLSEHQVEPNSSLGKALNYMLNRWDKLTAFCRIENAPLDNNNVEAMLKIAIRTRKNAIFYKTNNGAYIAGMMMSLIETCRVNGINPTLYLNYLQENAENVAKHPQKYLPWLYTEGKIKRRIFEDPPLAKTA